MSDIRGISVNRGIHVPIEDDPESMPKLNYASLGAAQEGRCTETSRFQSKLNLYAINKSVCSSNNSDGYACERYDNMRHTDTMTSRSHERDK